MNTLIYVNPQAGQGKPLKFLRNTLKDIGSEYQDVTIVLADSKLEGLEEFTTHSSHATKALCVGGDGTVHDIARICIEKNIPLGIIPSGSGDDIAHSIGITTPKTEQEYRSLVKRFLVENPTERSMTAGKITFEKGSQHFVLGVMSCGFDAHCNAIANTLKIRGPVRYVLAMLIGLRRFVPVTMGIEVDGQSTQRSIMMMAIGNGPSYGSGMKVVPHANPFTSSLSAIIVNQCSKAKFLTIFPRVFKGTHVEHRLVESLTFEHLKIAIDSRQPIFGDGEFFDHGNFEIEIVPQALRVLIP